MIRINASADITSGQKFKIEDEAGATAIEYSLIVEIDCAREQRNHVRLWQRAQQSRLIGYLSSGTPDFDVVRIAVFRAGLSEANSVEGLGAYSLWSLWLPQ
jgi:hypothetical protein